MNTIKDEIIYDLIEELVSDGHPREQAENIVEAMALTKSEFRALINERTAPYEKTPLIHQENKR